MSLSEQVVMFVVQSFMQPQKLKIPTLIHEQNSVAGLTNKFLSRYTDKVAICFEEVSDSFASEKNRFHW